MNPHELDITIDKTGKVQVHIQGIKGKNCMEIAKILQQIVGKMVNTKQTAEFYEPESKVATDINLENRQE